MVGGLADPLLGVLMIYGLYLFATCLAINLLALALPRPPTGWMEGWLIPHTVRRDHCRVDCATCR